MRVHNQKKLFIPVLSCSKNTLNSELPTETKDLNYTICPGSSDPYHIVTYCIKLLLGHTVNCGLYEGKNTTFQNFKRLYDRK